MAARGTKRYVFFFSHKSIVLNEGQALPHLVTEVRAIFVLPSAFLIVCSGY